MFLFFLLYLSYVYVSEAKELRKRKKKKEVHVLNHDCWKKLKSTMGRYGIVTLHNIFKTPWNPCRIKDPKRSTNAGIPRSLTWRPITRKSCEKGGRDSVIDVIAFISELFWKNLFHVKTSHVFDENISRNLEINIASKPMPKRQVGRETEKLIAFPYQIFIILQIPKINATLPNNSTNLSSNQPPPDPATAAGLVVYLIQSLNSHRLSPTWLKEPRPLVKLT